MKTLMMIMVAVMATISAPPMLDIYATTSSKWFGVGLGASRSSWTISGDVVFKDYKKFMGDSTPSYMSANISYQPNDFIGPMVGYTAFFDGNEGFTYGGIITPWRKHNGPVFIIRMMSFKPVDNVYEHRVIIGAGIRFSAERKSNVKHKKSTKSHG